MTRISYNPILSAGDEPSRNVEERAFVASSGAPVLDIDSIYGASDGGDYHISATGAFTDAGTTVADTSGDLVQQWEGQRSTGTSITVTQTTASSKPELATDATHGLSTLWPGGALKWISQEAFSQVGSQLCGVRFRLDNVSAGTNASNGMAFGGEDFQGLVDCLGAITQDLYVATVADSLRETTTTISDTNWHTLVFQGRQVGAQEYVDIYLDDMNTPIDEIAIGGFDAMVNYRIGHGSATLSGFHIYKMMTHTNKDAATPAELASWLED